MAYDSRELQVKINGDTTGLDKALGNTTNGLKSAGDKIGEFAKVASVALLAVGTAAVGFGIAAVKAFDDGQAVIAQTNAVLKSTAGIAGVTADQVDNLANKFMGLTKYDDDTVRSAENMLLTFTNIHENVFPATTQAVLDMSTAMGQDLQSTAIQVGKALQDPVQGATALQRVGVRLTETQKDLIKQLVATGDVAGAQTVILKELQTEFGGSAEAAGKTFGGQLTILKNRLGDVQKGIGEAIEKGIYPILIAFNDWFNSIGGVDGALKILGDTFSKFMAFMKPIFDGIVNTYKAVSDYLTPKLIALRDVIVKVLLPALTDWWKNTLVPLAKYIGEIFVGAVGGLVDTIKNLIKPVTDTAKQIGDYLTPKFMELWKSLQKNIIPILMDLWKNVIEPLIPVLGTTLVVAIGAVVDGFKFITDGIGFVKDGFDKGNPVIITLTAAFAGLAAVMAFNAIFDAITTGFTIFTLVTMPAADLAISTFVATVLAPIIMPAIAVGAALAAIALVMDAWNKMQSAISGAKSAQDDLNKITADTNNHFITVANDYYSSPEVKARARAFLHTEGVAGYAIGGYTGAGGSDEIAGVVHKGEYVLPQSQVDQSTGQPKASGVNLTVNVGMYAGMPVEKREIALSMYRELVRAARSQGVSMPMIGAGSVQ